MLNRRNIITLLAGTILAGTSAMPAFAQDRLQVVATFSILGDLVRQVGGDRIALTNCWLVRTGMDMSIHPGRAMRVRLPSRVSFSQTGCSTRAGSIA